MVRIVLLLAGLMAACCAGAPGASAALVPTDLQSTVTAVQQDPVAAVADAGAAVTTTVRPAVEQVGDQAAAGTGAPATGTVETASELAAPRTEYSAASAAPVTADERVAIGATVERVSPAPRRERMHGRTSPSTPPSADRAVPPGRTVALAHPPAEQTSHARAHAAPQTAVAPDQPRRSPSGGGAPAASPSAGIAVVGFALLAIVLCLTGPRLRHRLDIRLAAARPVAFVSLLERPG